MRIKGVYIWHRINIFNTPFRNNITIGFYFVYFIIDESVPAEML